MAALKLDMTIPFGDGGHVGLVIDITDIAVLGPEHRAFLADTVAEVCALGGRILAPHTAPVIASIELGAEPERREPAAELYDPNLAVLGGVIGTRANRS